MDEWYDANRRIDRWGAGVAALLRPGGRLVMREGHPVLWSLDGRGWNPTGAGTACRPTSGTSCPSWTR